MAEFTLIKLGHIMTASEISETIMILDISNSVLKQVVVVLFLSAIAYQALKFMRNLTKDDKDDGGFLNWLDPLGRAFYDVVSDITSVFYKDKSKDGDD